MAQSILLNLRQKGPLQARQGLRGHQGNSKGKTLFFSLNLTTLIDAFCILVIFLLSNVTSQIEQVQIGKGLSLPVAVQADMLSQGTMVRIESNGLYVNNIKTSESQLLKALIDDKAKNKKALIIQADKSADFERISLLLRAGGQAGFEKYLFAVLPGASGN